VDNLQAMRSPVLPRRYFLLLFLIIGAMMAAVVLVDLATYENVTPHLTLIINSPFVNPLCEKIFETLFIAILILILYTIGVYFIVRKIPDEVSRYTAARIFSILLIGLGVLLGMIEWVDNPGQVVLIIGIIWGALLVALRDFIQNLVGSLMLLVTRMYTIGDRIHIRGMYGVVLDIGVFRTSLMKLDEESGDHPSGNITTLPNGILFREVVTNTSRDLSFTSDELKITLPFTVDIQKTRELILGIVDRHTRDVQEQAEREVERLSKKKHLPDFTTKPSLSVHIDRHQILVVVKYYTDPRRRAEIKNEVVGEISQVIPGIIEVER
jgi:small-conductance mechanosensitive channel